MQPKHGPNNIRLDEINSGWTYYSFHCCAVVIYTQCFDAGGWCP